MPVPPQRRSPAVERTVTTRDGLSLQLVEHDGAGPPTLLFVHGAVGHAHVWDFVIAALPPHIRAFALSLPGHGDSQWALSQHRYAFDRVVDDLADAVAHVAARMAQEAGARPAAARLHGGREAQAAARLHGGNQTKHGGRGAQAGARPILVGHSIGSALAMHYAAAHSDALSALVLMDIDPHSPQAHQDRLNEGGARPPRRHATLEEVTTRMARIAPNATPALHAHLAEHGYRHTPSGYVQKFDQAFLRAVTVWDARELLPQISVPTLALRGADSTVMSRDGYDQLLDAIPDVRGAHIPSATHQLHLDQPDAVAAKISHFAAEIVSSADIPTP